MRISMRREDAMPPSSSSLTGRSPAGCSGTSPTAAGIWRENWPRVGNSLDHGEGQAAARGETADRDRALEPEEGLRSRGVLGHQAGGVGDQDRDEDRTTTP